MRDPTTGLFDRSLFRELVRERLTPLSALLVVDVDCLKSCNDMFGTEETDRYLQGVGCDIHRCAPACLAGRVGGDEFGILVADGRFAGEVAESIRLAVEANYRDLRARLMALTARAVTPGEWALRAPNLLTVSVGIAVQDDGPMSTGELLSAAYGAANTKAGGGNRVRYARPGAIA